MTGEAVASDDNLLVELVEVVENIEEFLLGFFLTDDELEIVDDEDVEFAEFKVEFFAFAEFNGVDEIGIEVGDGSVEDFEGRVAREEGVADGLDEVGFAEAGAAVEEEGVVAGAGGVDDAAGGGNGEVVVATDDEIIKGVFGVETGGGIVGFADVVTDFLGAGAEGGLARLAT